MEWYHWSNHEVVGKQLSIILWKCTRKDSEQRGYFGEKDLDIQLQDGLRLTSQSQVFNAILAARHSYTDDNNAHNDDDDRGNDGHQDIEIQPLWPPIRQPGNVTVRDRWWQRGCKQHNDIMPLFVYSVYHWSWQRQIRAWHGRIVQPSMSLTPGRQHCSWALPVLWQTLI